MGDVTQPNEEEVASLLKASRQLGSDYDQDIARQIVDRIHSWGPEPPNPTTRRRDPKHQIAVLSIVMSLSIPMMAIAAWIAKAHGFYAVLGLDAIVILSALWN
jgi:hypothetical protein